MSYFRWVFDHISGLILLRTRAGKAIPLVVFSVCIFNLCVHAQPVSDKKGGIIIRIDDNQPMTKLHQVDSVFSKYGYNFCMSIGSMELPSDSVYVVFLKQLIAKGHEVMDHSPSQTTQYFKLDKEQDTSLYKGDPGVDHITSNKVCLKYSKIDTSVHHNEGLVDIQGNLVISHTPGEFQDIGSYIGLYFDQLNKPSIWYEIRASNPFDVDSLIIQSLWEEPVDFGTLTNLSYHKLSRNDVWMTDRAVQLLGKRTLKVFSDLNIPRPWTWIHPGGRMPYIPTVQIKQNLGDSLAYKEAATYNYPTYLCFNEYNPEGMKQFAMQYGQISIESKPFKWNRHLIANFIARHYTQIDLTHLYNPLGGWIALLNRYDSLLNWCYSNNIPVNTHLQWKAILYNYTPDGSVNIFPALNVDLDEDSYPDGYENDPNLKSLYSINDGVPESGGCCFETNSIGGICKISELAGLEKGKNTFSIWTKGTTGITDTIRVHLTFPENGIVKTLHIPADLSTWTKYTDTIIIPDTISVMDVYIDDMTPKTSTIKISGMDISTTGPFVVDFTSDKVCGGYQTTLASTSSPLDSIQVLKWDFNGDGKFEDATGDTIFRVFSGPGIYNVGLKGITYSGKSKAIYKDVYVSGVKAQSAFSSGCEGQSLNFRDQSVATGDYITNYYWDFGDGSAISDLQNPVHIYDYSDMFFVKHRVTTSAGCSDSLTKVITIYAPPLISLIFTGDTIFPEGDSVVVHLDGITDSLRWSTGETSSMIVIKNSGYYWVRGYKNGCYSELSFNTTVKELGTDPVVMNLFTPNGDGYNDHWEILNLNKIGPCDVAVYNRFGVKVLSEPNYQNDWEGIFNGKALPNDTYYYFIRCLTDKLYKGSVNILK